MTGLVFVYLVWPWLSGRNRPLAVNLLPLLALAGLVVHLTVEGYRWQMVPIYFLLGVTALHSLFGLIRRQTRPFRRLSWESAAICIGLLILGVGVAIAVWMPVRDLAQPAGPYRVGVTSLTLVDDSRREINSADPNEPRRLIVQIWYPGLPADGAQPAPWMPDGDILAPAIAAYSGFPPFFLDHLKWVKTNSYPDAPLDPAGKPYPLLLFSHGWNGFRTQNVHHMEELASHGYIVASIEHPYAAIATVFPDGQVVLNNPDILPLNASDEEIEPAARVLGEQWEGDIRFTLDRLAKMNNGEPPTPWMQSLDLAKIGVFGHSTGAGATIQFCSNDPRCTAGLTLDAWMGPVSEAALDSGVSQPFLFIFSERWPSVRNKALFARFSPHAAQSIGVYTILGSDHYDFLDSTLLPPAVGMFNLKGPISTTRMTKIIDAYSLAFFDLTLKGKTTSLFAEPAQEFPEARLDR